ncbi:MAG TPA: RDD family protein [Polyangiaceae bacterium]|nr:RDD family protein [Polyangiaceae bacterium]
MPWLWFAGPFVFLLVYLLLSVWPTQEEKRIQAELLRWLDDYIGPLRDGKKSRSRRVRGLPPQFDQLVQDIGEGPRVCDVVLVPKNAYLAARLSGGMTSTNQFTVVCALEDAAPAFTCRPLPIVDGKPAENRGILFGADRAFGTAFLVEGAQTKPITKWMSSAVREALLELPEAFLVVRGRMMALTVHGAADADKLDELVDVADAIYAEHGATGDALLGEAHESAKKRVKQAVEREESAPALLRIKASAIDFGLYAVAGLFIALVVGKFGFFHPSVLFNSPDLDPSEQWQGGWTTKGVGAFIAVEALFVGLFAYQSYAGALRGSSIGMRLLGAKVVDENGNEPGFVRGVLLRRWLFALLPILVALVLARPFGVRGFVEHIVSWPVAVAGVVVLGGVAASMLRGTPIQDRVSKTRVVLAERWYLPAVQLGAAGVGIDPVAFGRLTRVGGLMLAFIALNFLIVGVLDLGYWPYEAPFRLVEALVGVFRK